MLSVRRLDTHVKEQVLVRYVPLSENVVEVKSFLEAKCVSQGMSFLVFDKYT
jgi:hypothetical protein